MAKEIYNTPNLDELEKGVPVYFIKTITMYILYQLTTIVVKYM